MFSKALFASFLLICALSSQVASAALFCPKAHMDEKELRHQFILTMACQDGAEIKAVARTPDQRMTLVATTEGLKIYETPTGRQLDYKRQKTGTSFPILPRRTPISSDEKAQSPRTQLLVNHDGSMALYLENNVIRAIDLTQMRETGVAWNVWARSQWPRLWSPLREEIHVSQISLSSDQNFVYVDRPIGRDVHRLPDLVKVPNGREKRTAWNLTSETDTKIDSDLLKDSSGSFEVSYGHASDGQGQLLRIRDTRTGELKALRLPIESQKKEFENLVISPKGGFVALLRKDLLQIYHLPTGRLQYEYNEPVDFTALWGRAHSVDQITMMWPNYWKVIFTPDEKSFILGLTIVRFAEARSLTKNSEDPGEFASLVSPISRIEGSWIYFDDPNYAFNWRTYRYRHLKRAN